MKHWYDAAEAIEKLGITGILGGVIVILGAVIRKLWAIIIAQNSKMIKLAQGKDID